MPPSTQQLQRERDLRGSQGPLFFGLFVCVCVFGLVLCFSRGFVMLTYAKRRAKMMKRGGGGGVSFRDARNARFGAWL